MANNLLNEKVNRNNVDKKCGGNALYVKGGSIDKGKSQERARFKSKSHHNLKDMECYNCGKKGHLKRDCHFAKKDKEKT